MKLDLNSQTLNVSFACRIEDAWVPVPETACTQSGFDWTLNGAHYSAQFTPAGDTLCYTLQMDAPTPTQLRMWLAVPGQSDYFHVIPCNIYGDNHAAEAKPGEFPLLTKDHHEVAFCAPLWEFRADRAAMPLAALCWDGGVAAAAVEPYSESEAGIIRNGVFAALPDAFGISLGYTNDPTTFKNRSTPAPSTRSMACKAQTSGRIYLHSGPRTELHEIIRQEYARHQDRAVPRNTLRQAVQGMLDTFAYQNFDAAAGEYTNRCCRPPRETEMRPWRLVTEIGWTGGGVLAYPLVLCRDALGADAEAPLAAAMSGEQLFDRIADLARVTGDGYYASRAADSAAWMLQCLELYPAVTGYGRYGILSERWCPSDGLDVERFSDGRPFSSWFSHNLWASACVLEAACELLLEIEHKKG